MEDQEVILATELGEVAASLLDKEQCGVCGSHFVFMDGRRSGKYTWWIYVKCPVCDSAEDELRAFRIRRGRKKLG